MIADAEQVLRDLRAREARLKASIRIFKARLSAGEPLPDWLLQFRITDETLTGTLLEIAEGEADHPQGAQE